MWVEDIYRLMEKDTLLSSAFFAVGSSFMEEALDLTGESEDEDVYTLLNLDDTNGQNGSRINWNGRYTY